MKLAINNGSFSTPLSDEKAFELIKNTGIDDVDFSLFLPQKKLKAGLMKAIWYKQRNRNSVWTLAV